MLNKIMMWLSLLSACLYVVPVESKLLRGLEEMSENGGACLTEEQCEQLFQNTNTGGSFFYVSNYPTKGCFSRNGNIFFGTDGTVEEMSETDLTGNKERIWCGVETGDTDLLTVDSSRLACLTEDQCKQIFQNMNTDGSYTFYVGSYSTKGCFSRNGKVFFGTDGTVEEMSDTDLGGTKERIWCETETNVPTYQPSTRKPTRTPTAKPITPASTPVPVSGVNTPVARDDVASVSLAGGDLAFFNILINDTPAAGQILFVRSIASPASHGQCSISLDMVEVVYMPNDGFYGVDSCDYEICDQASECDTATLEITVE